jgi:4-hydroxybenzoate polyprenyltransferase
MGLKAYLQLCRPANLPTAAADILAGMAISGVFVTGWQLLPGTSIFTLVFLVASSVLLYAGGVVFNDVFDAELDKIERPERPIPSGSVPKSHAVFLGVTLLFLGCVLAYFVSVFSGAVAIILVVSILFYDRFAKHHSFWGPLVMGICRMLNLYLGMSVLGFISAPLYGLVPLVFIGAITLISRGEVHGHNKKNIVLALLAYGLVILGVAFLNYICSHHLSTSLIFLVLFALMAVQPVVKAYKENTPLNIKRAVKAGVISLIILDASLVASYADWKFALLTLLLLPFSILLSKLFTVT